jgi:hypothetical protein
MEQPILDLKGRILTLNDLVILADANELDNEYTQHNVGDVFKFIG